MFRYMPTTTIYFCSVVEAGFGWVKHYILFFFNAKFPLTSAGVKHVLLVSIFHMIVCSISFLFKSYVLLLRLVSFEFP